MQTTLRPATTGDLDFIVRAEDAAENRAWIIPWTREQHESALADPDVAVLMVEANSEPVGFIILAGCANRDVSVEFKRVVITAKGKGYGREAVQHIKRLALSEWGTARLWLDVKSGNDRARSLYESEGFVRESEIPDPTDAQSTLIIMSITRV